MDNKNKFEETIYAQWCWDSETGDKLLIDLKTGQVIGKWVKTEDNINVS